MIEEDTLGFLTAVAETPTLWRSIDVRVVALFAEGAWHNMVARFLLMPLSPHQIRQPTDFPSLPNFAVFKQVFKSAELRALIHSVRKGSLNVQGASVQFMNGIGTATVSVYERSDNRIGFDISENVSGRYEFGHLLNIYGEPASQLFRFLPRQESGLDTALRGLPDPWGSASDLLLHGLDDKTGLRGHSVRRAVFVAPLQAAIINEECGLAGGILTFGIRAATKRFGASCTLVVTGSDSHGKRVARRIPLLEAAWAKARDGFVFVGSEELPMASKIKLTLQLATFELGCLELLDPKEMPPLLLGAYEALFPGKRNFPDRLLHPVRTDAHAFEKDVALLLMYCGMAVEYIGDGPDTKEAPDLLVNIPNTSIVLVVEITVGALNQNGKLARLTQRADLVRARIESSGGLVIPVIVTSNRRRAIAQGELDDAKVDRIRVISREDLSVLLKLSRRHASVYEVAKFLAPEMIPGP